MHKNNFAQVLTKRTGKLRVAPSGMEKEVDENGT
jgi:hypothetical protein